MIYFKSAHYKLTLKQNTEPAVLSQYKENNPDLLLVFTLKLDLFMFLFLIYVKKSER